MKRSNSEKRYKINQNRIGKKIQQMTKDNIRKRKELENDFKGRRVELLMEKEKK
jgi:hypothetical protein